jgi:hypothetical protein
LYKNNVALQKKNSTDPVSTKIEKPITIESSQKTENTIIEKDAPSLKANNVSTEQNVPIQTKKKTTPPTTTTTPDTNKNEDRIVVKKPFVVHKTMIKHDTVIKKTPINNEK